jgi:hypothetical protein
MFAGGTWSTLGTDAGLDNPFAITFDPTHRRMVALADPLSSGSANIYVLPSDASGSDIAWSLVGPALPVPTSTAAISFDAANNVVVVLTDLGEVYAFNGASWSSTLSPGAIDYAVVSDERRGSVDFVAPGDTLWERDGTNWSEAGTEPIAVDGTAQYDAGNGRIILLGQVGLTSRVIETRQLTSALPQETCEPGVDADHDGKVDCDDEDCWWKCTPACPPVATCPAAP